MNPSTGTASISIPIFTSPGRSEFYPKLSISYDSGAGNGPFGFGWNVSLPSITRKTDKGIPQYRDVEESDVFILSGAEDLMRVLEETEEGWVPVITPPPSWVPVIPLVTNRGDIALRCLGVLFVPC